MLGKRAMMTASASEYSGDCAAAWAEMAERFDRELAGAFVPHPRGHGRCSGRGDACPAFLVVARPGRQRTVRRRRAPRASRVAFAFAMAAARFAAVSGTGTFLGAIANAVSVFTWLLNINATLFRICFTVSPLVPTNQLCLIKSRARLLTPATRTRPAYGWPRQFDGPDSSSNSEAAHRPQSHPPPTGTSDNPPPPLPPGGF